MANMKVTKDTFDAEVLKSEKPVIVDFYADWCGPCKMMAPLLDRLAEELADQLKVVKINIDEQEELAVRYRIMSIPTMIIFKNGGPKETMVGALPYEELKQRVMANIN